MAREERGSFLNLGACIRLPYGLLCVPNVDGSGVGRPVEQNDRPAIMGRVAGLFAAISSVRFHCINLSREFSLPIDPRESLNRNQARDPINPPDDEF